MITRQVLFFSLILLIVGCGPGGRQVEGEVSSAVVEGLSGPEADFLNNLSGLCGKSYRGRETFMAEGRESWSGKDLVMHVSLCETGGVHIPFHIDDDTSRTWMFIVEGNRLRFRHDHRHPDGTPEALTMYGGYANGKGTAFRQYFPADEFTVDLLSDTLGRQWNIVMDEAMTNFSYQLQYGGELVFQADFDLTGPLEH